ncbi:S-receptor-like serine/threonine-protein kinase [Quillaja saponaria]|uniref:Receptor-like serine/threonine-protein kinase n=1 Tax=Quillaja saponaria TaxID=32244 RepID=A0AAD7PV19_QUISA|nr:S-receptor-like serine/threonine-protein kinase [Quillaja saponaria]
MHFAKRSSLLATIMSYITKALLVSLIQLLLVGFCLPLDNITVGKSIRDGENLVSSGQNFALGFFSPGKSSNRYVGIWFNKVSVQTVVWVANRDHPINDTSGVLSINNKGNLVLHHKYSNFPIWSTNCSATVAYGTVSAKLLDIGNLVLSQTDSKSIIWQSFDSPTNTMVPYYKVGLDRRTNVTTFLQSWKTSDDPSAGSSTYQVDTSGQPQLFIYKHGIQKWRTGPWNGEELNGLPQPQHTSTFRESFVNNEDEITTMYQVLDKSIISKITLDESGHLQTYIWNDREHQWSGIWYVPQKDCDNYGLCGPNANCNPFKDEQFRCTCLPGYELKSLNGWHMNSNRSGGCLQKQHVSMCGNGEGFVKVENVKFPDTYNAVVEKHFSLKECTMGCLRDCSCTAHAIADVRRGGSGCMTWYGNLTDTEMLAEGGHDLYIRVDATELEKYKSKSFLTRKGKLAILVVSASVIFLLAAFSVYWFRKRNIRTIRYLNNDSPREGDNHEGGAHLPFFSLGTVLAATDNFSSSNKLGQGGFGPVYKGQLVNGLEIAVKRLSKSSGQGATEFKNEVKLIAKLQHRNLVRLLGFCVHSDERMLIYEYLPNKSLDFFIFDKNQKSLLDWSQRFNIILGIARGVLYLHQDSRLKIIHRDLKASNVLLDATMNPKISDFGMARMFGEDQVQGSTNRIVGTYGYMSPEYAMEGRYSTQSDVFSFGVILLEIITGKKNTDHENERPSRNLIEYVWDFSREGRPLEIVDSTLAQSYPIPEVMRCIQLGLLCVQECANDRPTMFTVVFMLGNETTLPSPNKPAFIKTRNQNQPESSTSGGGGSSVCDITTSLIKGR